MIGTTSHLQNSRNIIYPSISICPKRAVVDPYFNEEYCYPCEYERKTNISEMLQRVVYHYINESKTR